MHIDDFSVFTLFYFYSLLTTPRYIWSTHCFRTYHGIPVLLHKVTKLLTFVSVFVLCNVGQHNTYPGDIKGYIVIEYKLYALSGDHIPIRLMMWIHSKQGKLHINREQAKYGVGGVSYLVIHDDVIKWKHFPRYWPFVRGIHRSPVNSQHKSQWRELWCFLWSASE